MIILETRTARRRLRCALQVSIVAFAQWLMVSTAQAERVIDWRADHAPGAKHAWSVNRFGPVRSATARVERARAGVADAELVVDLDSGNDKAPPAQLAHVVPFRQGHHYRIFAELSAESPVRAVFMMRRRDKPFEPMIQRTVHLTPEPQRVELDGAWPYTDGAGDVRLLSTQPKAKFRVRSLQVDDLGKLPLGQLPVAAFNTKLLGIHVNKLDEHKTWPAIGTGLVRLWDTRTNWHHLGPTPEAFDAQANEAWQRLDRYVDYVERNDAGAILLMTLGQPPRWASASPDATCAYGPGTCGAPKSLDLWRHYVRTLAVRYKGRIRHWELWNEPNYIRFYVPTVSLVELAKAAREELKAVDPGNMLVSPGFTPWGMGWLEGFFASGGGQYVDAIGFHWYFDGQPEKLAPMIHNVRQTIKQHGQEAKAIWVTEGSPNCGSRARGFCEMGGLAAEESDTVVERAIMTMWLNGVEAYAYYTVEGMAGRSVALMDLKTRALTDSGKKLAAFGKMMNGARAEAVTAWGRAGHAVKVRLADSVGYVVWSEEHEEALQVPSGWGVNAYKILGKDIVPLPANRNVQVGRVPVMLVGGAGSAR